MEALNIPNLIKEKDLKVSQEESPLAKELQKMEAEVESMYDGELPFKELQLDHESLSASLFKDVSLPSTTSVVFPWFVCQVQATYKFCIILAIMEPIDGLTQAAISREVYTV